MRKKVVARAKIEQKQEQVKQKKRFPFWGRLKIEKKRPTLVIDETTTLNKKTKKIEPGYVHREVTSKGGRDVEEVKPNPKPNTEDLMYLKRPRKIPKRLISESGPKWEIPKTLKERYEKNNREKEQ